MPTGHLCFQVEDNITEGGCLLSIDEPVIVYSSYYVWVLTSLKGRGGHRPSDPLMIMIVMMMLEGDYDDDDDDDSLQ